jgi:hypothetical protein
MKSNFTCMSKGPLAGTRGGTKANRVNPTAELMAPVVVDSGAATGGPRFLTNEDKSCDGLTDRHWTANEL